MTEVGTAMELHRLLDEAFAGIEMTPETQDLKEEMRANLVVRVTELTDAGLRPELAAQRAMAELGDVRSIVDETRSAGQGIPAHTRNRVRPNPSYVVRTVVLSVLAAAALAAVVVPFFGPAVPLGARLVAAAVVAVIGGVIVADALRQETTTSYPLPGARAAGFGVATALVLAGAGGPAVQWRDRPLPWLVGGGLAVLVGIVVFTYLGATQTNRHKPWMVRLQAAQEQAGDRFTEDPAAAARFGLYTVTIWLLAFAAFAVLSFTVGWAWSWLALLAGVVAMMVTLARTLFAPHSEHSPR